ncbi:MAG: tryptophan--tRNA ligase, partial [Mycetocola sp.]
EAKPGVSNLLAIHAALTGQSIEAITEEFTGRGYGDLKKAVAESVTGTFTPIAQRTAELLDDPAELDRILSAAADVASERAERTLEQVYNRVGLLRPGRR